MSNLSITTTKRVDCQACDALLKMNEDCVIVVIERRWWSFCSMRCASTFKWPMRPARRWWWSW